MLVLIDENLTNYDVRLLVKWRNKNRNAYKDKIKVTNKSMYWWLNNHYFNKKRVLFWVVYRNKKIGTMGLNNFKDNSCEIDSCMRGEDSGKQQMGIHLNTLIKLAFKLVDKLYLRVIKTNIHAIEFYKKHGFKSLHIEDIYLKMQYEN